MASSQGVFGWRWGNVGNQTVEEIGVEIGDCCLVEIRHGGQRRDHQVGVLVPSQKSHLREERNDTQCMSA